MWTGFCLEIYNSSATTCVRVMHVTVGSPLLPWSAGSAPHRCVFSLRLCGQLFFGQPRFCRGLWALCQLCLRASASNGWCTVTNTKSSMIWFMVHTYDMIRQYDTIRLWDDMIMYVYKYNIIWTWTWTIMILILSTIGSTYSFVVRATPCHVMASLTSGCHCFKLVSVFQQNRSQAIAQDFCTDNL